MIKIDKHLTILISGATSFSTLERILSLRRKERGKGKRIIFSTTPNLSITGNHKLNSFKELAHEIEEDRESSTTFLWKKDTLWRKPLNKKTLPLPRSSPNEIAKTTNSFKARDTSGRGKADSGNRRGKTKVPLRRLRRNLHLKDLSMSFLSKENSFNRKEVKLPTFRKKSIRKEYDADKHALANRLKIFQDELNPS